MCIENLGCHYPKYTYLLNVTNLATILVSSSTWHLVPHICGYWGDTIDVLCTAADLPHHPNHFSIVQCSWGLVGMLPKHFCTLASGLFAVLLWVITYFMFYKVSKNKQEDNKIYQIYRNFILLTLLLPH